MDADQEAARRFVREILRVTGWNANQLAREAGIAHTTISRFINNQDVTHTLSTRTLSKIRTAHVAWDSEAAFNKALRGRIRELRKAGPWNQEQMAEALGIPAERYRKYETRSPMPPYLIQRFALIVRRDAAFVLTGKDPQHRVAGIFQKAP